MDIDRVDNIVRKTTAGACLGILAYFTGGIIYGHVDKPLSEVNPLVAKFDEDGDNRLSVQEATKLLISLDKNKDGILSEEELKEADKLLENSEHTILPYYIKYNILNSQGNLWLARQGLLSTQNSEVKEWLEKRKK